VDLVLRRGLPLPTLADFDYLSFQPGPTPDVIVVGTNSFPVPIGPGEWYAGVINQTTGSVTYSMLAEENIGGEVPPFHIDPEVVVSGGTVTLNWTAQAGLRFQVQYATEIPANGPIQWIDVPGEITSSTTLYQFVDDGSLTGGPAPLKFYRLQLVGGGGGGPPTGGVTLTPSFDTSSGNVTLTWVADPGLRFQVQYADGIPAGGNIVWTTVPGEVTSADGTYEFVDDGSQTGGMAPNRLYRVVLIE
jgi:hypothetical protein